MNDRKSPLGSRVRELREGRGLTQEGLADKAGVDPRTIRRIENGEQRRFAKDTLGFIAKALGVLPEELVQLTEETPRPQVRPQQLIAIRSGHDFFAVLTTAQAYSVRAGDAKNEGERWMVKALLDEIETAEIWEDLTPGQRYETEQRVTELLRELAERRWGVCASRTVGTFELPSLPHLNPLESTIPNWVTVELIVMKMVRDEAGKGEAQVEDAIAGEPSPTRH